MAPPRSVRAEVERRLQTGELYTLPELRALLSHLLKQLSQDARRDFDKLLFLSDQLRRQTDGRAPVAVVASSGDGSGGAGSAAEIALPPKVEHTLPPMPMPPSLQGGEDGAGAGAGAPVDVTAMFRDVIVSLHHAVVRVCRLLAQQKDERVQLCRHLAGQVSGGGAASDT